VTIRTSSESSTALMEIRFSFRMINPSRAWDRHAIHFNLTGSRHEVASIRFAKGVYYSGPGLKQGPVHLGVGTNRQ